MLLNMKVLENTLLAPRWGISGGKKSLSLREHTA